MLHDCYYQPTPPLACVNFSIWWRLWAYALLLAFFALELFRTIQWEYQFRLVAKGETIWLMDSNSSNLNSVVSKLQTAGMLPVNSDLAFKISSEYNQNQSRATGGPAEMSLPATTVQPSPSYTASSSSQASDNLCTREEVKEGVWSPVTLPEIPYVPHLRCLPGENYESGKPWKTWDWQPLAVKAGNCTLLQWSASRFCSLAHFATVAIVGDSLSWEQYASLVQLLGLQTSEQRQYDSLLQGKIIVDHVCQGQVRLIYLRDDYLTQVARVIKTTSPNVLILNRGAHFTADVALETDLRNLTADLIEWQNACEASQRPCQLLVRTTVPGHPQCWNFTEPVNSVREMEAQVADLSKYNETMKPTILLTGVISIVKTN